MTHIVPNWVSGHFRWRNDDGSLSTATWKGPEDAACTTATDTNFRLRINWGESANQSEGDSIAPFLQFRINGGSWTTVGSATAVKYSTSGQSITDGTTDSADRITTAPTGCAASANTREYDDNNTTTSRSWADQWSELEFCLQANSASVSEFDYIEFQLVYGSSTAFDVYDTVPGILIDDGSRPDVLVVSHTTTLPTATDTSWSVSPSALSGITPKAVLVTLSRATTDATAIDEGDYSFGAGTGSGAQWCTSFHDAHGETSTTNVQSRLDTTIIGGMWGSTDTQDSTLALVSLDSGGATFNFQYSAIGGVQANFLFFAGSDLAAHAGTDQMQTTQQTLTGTSMKPTCLFLSSIHHASVNSQRNALYCSHAFVSQNYNETIDLACESIQATEAVSTTTNSSSTNSVSNRAGEQLTTTGTVEAHYTVDQLVYDGFLHTATNVSHDPGGDYFGYLALDTKTLKTWTDTDALPASTGDDSVTAPGFRPQAIGLFASSGPTGGQSVATWTFGFGNTDGTTESCITASSEDAVSTTNTQSYYVDDILGIPQDDGTSVRNATFVSFDANGYTLNYSQSTPSITAVFWAIEEPDRIATGDLQAQDATIDGSASTEAGATRTATGDLDAQDSTIDGSATQVAKATGDLAAQVSVLDGTATQISIASGDLTTGDATIDGSASRVKTASGDLTTGDATISGTAVQVSIASGDLSTGDAVIAGDADRIANASGDLSTGDSTLDGTALRTALASGDLTTGDAAIDGTATQVAIASGDLTTGDSVIDGEAVAGAIITASGDLVTGDSTINGAALRTANASGDLQAQDSTIAGTAIQAAQASGDLTTGASSIAGEATQVSIASGDLSTDPSTISGTAVQVSNASGDLTTGDSVIDGSADTSVAASGDLTTGDATINGTAIQVSNASGDVTTGDATITGSATQVAIASGDLTTGDATVSGSAVQVAIAAGDLTTGDATTDGEATAGADIFASGDLEAQDATVSGDALRTANASGDPQAQDSTITGDVTRTALATGDLATGSATIDGSAVQVAVATGDLTTGDSTIDGSAQAGADVTASGDLVAQDVSLSGSATRTAQASGSLQSNESSVAGQSVRVSNVSGDLQSSNSVIDGSATAVSAEITASGDLQAQAATISGTAVQVDVATGALQVQDATVSGSAVQAAVAEGDLETGDATIDGSALRVGVVTASGDLEAGNATIDGSVTRTAGQIFGGIEARRLLAKQKKRKQQIEEQRRLEEIERQRIVYLNQAKSEDEEIVMLMVVGL